MPIPGDSFTSFDLTGRHVDFSEGLNEMQGSQHLCVPHCHSSPSWESGVTPVVVPVLASSGLSWLDPTLNLCLCYHNESCPVKGACLGDWNGGWLFLSVSCLFIQLIIDLN